MVASTSLGQPIDLIRVFKKLNLLKIEGIYSTEYYPEEFPGIIIHLKEPLPVSTICIFKSGKLNCLGCKNEKEIRVAIKEILNILKEEKLIRYEPKELKIDIKNIVCLADIGQKIGCGIVQRLFPGAKRINFGGEAFLVSYKEGSVRISLEGKICAIGFKNKKKAIEIIKEVARTIYSGLKEFNHKRGEICKLERQDPAIEALKRYGKELGVSEKTFQKAELIILEYYRKRIRDTACHQPKTIAAGALYIAAILCNEKVTQREVASTFNITMTTLRKGYKTIANTVDLSEWL